MFPPPNTSVLVESPFLLQTFHNHNPFAQVGYGLDYTQPEDHDTKHNTAVQTLGMLVDRTNSEDRERVAVECMTQLGAKVAAACAEHLIEHAQQAGRVEEVAKENLHSWLLEIDKKVMLGRKDDCYHQVFADVELDWWIPQGPNKSGRYMVKKTSFALGSLVRGLEPAAEPAYVIVGRGHSIAQAGHAVVRLASSHLEGSELDYISANASFPYNPRIPEFIDTLYVAQINLDEIEEK